jgi:hypothetical protein
MGEKFDRVDAITELYKLGTEAEALIIQLSELEDNARRYRLEGQVTAAQMTMTEYVLTCHKLEEIGLRQGYIIGELEAGGEVFYLG